MIQNRRLGLALGGGGARGLCHIGILKVLLRESIQIDYIAGTSMGGIVGAAFAAGLTVPELEAIALNISTIKELMKLVSLKTPNRGLLEGVKVEEFLASILPKDITFADLKIKTALCAVDMGTSRYVSLTEGPLLPAVLATSAMPGVFPVVEIGGLRLGDGGLLNNVPVNLTRQIGAEVVIAIEAQIDSSKQPPLQIHSYSQGWYSRLPDVFLDSMRAITIMSSEITRFRLKENPPDLLIQPPVPSDVTSLVGFHRAKEIIQYGEQAAESALPEIWRLLE